MASTWGTATRRRARQRRAIQRATAAVATMCGLAVSIAGAPVQAQDVSGALDKAVDDGRLIFTTRLRYEGAEQEGLPETANALTLGTRFGFETGDVGGFQFLLEFEDVREVFLDDFNSTTNGRTDFPVVADPNATELNRLQARYTGLDDVDATLGRQQIVLNNARFVGDVIFRQNQQTYDALRVRTTRLPGLDLQYIYIDQVQRIFGDDSAQGEFESNSHVVQADAATPFGALSTYALLLDFDNAETLSSATYGARLTGARPLPAGLTAQYVAEYARQTAFADNPDEIGANYVHGDVVVRRNAVGFGGGVEILGAGEEASLQTPLATLHKFQGFADAFLVTPIDGVRDLYAKAVVNWATPPVGQKLVGAVIYHDFTDDGGDLFYGREWDAVATLTATKRVTFELKAGFFNAEEAGFADLDRVWAAAQFTF